MGKENKSFIYYIYEAEISNKVIYQRWRKGQ